MVEGKAVMWQWLAGVTVAAGQVVTIGKEKKGAGGAYNTVLIQSICWSCITGGLKSTKF